MVWPSPDEVGVMTLRAIYSFPRPGYVS
ncbi:hypothetical protein Gohar_017809 [Gossypium harknessii]|uniref:Uncharacterized protein n=1 Tax=Gossypium harknessii TaxID=34285 RepID=A0A7J9G714_9ROSI|nr:hypothetical protein [Gossypium harknessii]